MQANPAVSRDGPSPSTVATSERVGLAQQTVRDSPPSRCGAAALSLSAQREGCGDQRRERFDVRARHQNFTQLERQVDDQQPGYNLSQHLQLPCTAVTTVPPR